MKSLIFIVLLVLAGIAGYNFVNKPTDHVEPVATVEDVTSSTKSEMPSSTDESISEQTSAPLSNNTNITTPTDMPEEAQHEMYTLMMDYNKCMMQDKPEYHEKNVKAEDIADKTLAACEPSLDALKAVLEVNNVNIGLREGMTKTLRKRSARKLLAAVRQSQAASIMANEAPIPTTP